MPQKDGLLKKRRSDELMMGGPERPYIPWNIAGPSSPTTSLFFGPSEEPTKVFGGGTTRGFGVSRAFGEEPAPPVLPPAPIGKTVPASSGVSSMFVQTGAGARPAPLRREVAPLEEQEVPDLASMIAEAKPGFNWDVFASTLGQLGAAVMGPFQETWQAQLGRAAHEMAQQSAYSRYTDAVMAGREPDPRDASILTPEQKTQAFQIADMIEQRGIEKSAELLDYRTKIQKMEQDREMFDIEVAEKRKELGLRAELTREEITGRETVAGMYSADRANTLAQAQEIWDAEWEAKTDAALYAKAIKEATEKARLYDEYDPRRVPAFNDTMRYYLGPEYKAIDEGVPVSAGDDEKYIP